MDNAQHWCFRMPWYTTQHGRFEQLRKISPIGTMARNKVKNVTPNI